MTTEHSDNWFLKKHESGEVFGPSRFEQIRVWAKAAQINPQDMLSTDREVWTKAPMFPELSMDWLIELASNLLYGPTSEEAMMEFYRLGEIFGDVHVLNCRTGERMILSEAPFFQEEPPQPAVEDFPQPPQRGILRVNLQKRIRDLETGLLEKNRLLLAAKDHNAKLEGRIREMELQIANIRNGRK